MADKLVLTEEKYKYRIQWEIHDEDGVDGVDLGGYLCQDPTDGAGQAPMEREEWEHWVASGAVRTTEGFNLDSPSAWWDWWESATHARAALRIAKEALKQERPMPDWAKTAIAAGWKPPKGWKA